MGMFRGYLIVAAVAAVALAGSPARADLEITVNGLNGTALCGGPPTPCYNTSDTSAYFDGSIGNFNINSITIAGWQAFGGSGELMDDSDLDISTSGAGSLTILLSQSNLTGGQILNLLGTFTNYTLLNIDETRQFWLDPLNGLNAKTTMLGCTSNINGCSFGANDNGALTFSSLQDLRLHGTYSLTEEIDLTATGAGGELSADDGIMVPEPVSLSLFGSGLLALGVMSRRWRKTAKKA